MGCSECARLACEYERLDRLHAGAVHSLNAQPVNDGIVEHKRLRVSANEAWLYAEIARLELQKHRDVHHKAN
jgi:hypothetical protein